MPDSYYTYGLLWVGTAKSVVNLNALLPSAGSWSDSDAYSVNAAGDVFGDATGTFNHITGEFAVEWTPPAVSWTSGVSGSWTNASIWSFQTVPGSTVGATFNTGSATPYSVTLTGNSIANSVTVQGDEVTIQKTGFTLTVPGAVTITGTAGENASLTLADSSTDTFGSLSIVNGRLHITDNVLTINYGVGIPSPVSAIGAYIKTGYNGGTWTGVGIISSQVASVNASKNDSHLYAIGYADASDPAVARDNFTPGTVVIEPALVGDANLDGVVNYTDFQLLSANFNGTGTSWDQGDFNYAGKTNYTDFQVVGQSEISALCRAGRSTS